MKTIALFSLAAALIGGAAIAAPDKPAFDRTKEARIPFADSAITDWSADGDRAIYIRANSKWYRAELMSFCRDLNVANAIGFDNGGGVGDFDHFSTLIVRGQRCPLRSLVRSDPPPRKAKHRK